MYKLLQHPRRRRAECGEGKANVGSALLARHPGVVLLAHVQPADLVLVAVLQLAAADQLLHLARGPVDHDGLLHLLLLLIRDLRTQVYYILIIMITIINNDNNYQRDGYYQQ
jgi:hypothetical protein